MNSPRKTSRVLGAAFLLQAVSSIVSKTVVRSAWLVPGDIAASLDNIARSPWLVRANILMDMVTALGIVFLGAMLFIFLRKQGEKLALVAFGFYLMEAVLLAFSQVAAFAFIPLSREYAAAGQPASLLALADLVLQSMDFAGSTLHMLAFCCGGILFYSLLYRSGLIPRALSLWGLITVFPCLAGTLAAALGFAVPFIIYVPYAPFEFVVGIWILVAGIQDAAGAEYRLASATASASAGSQVG